MKAIRDGQQLFAEAKKLEQAGQLREAATAYQRWIQAPVFDR